MAITWMVDILVPIEYDMKMSSHYDTKSYFKQKFCPQNLHAPFFECFCFVSILKFNFISSL